MTAVRELRKQLAKDAREILRNRKNQGQKITSQQQRRVKTGTQVNERRVKNANDS